MKHQLLFGFGFFCLVAAGGLVFHLGVTMAENYGQAQTFTEKTREPEPNLKQKEPQHQLETVNWAKKPKKGSKVAQLNIPSISASIPVHMGVSDRELDKGVGLHDTALPGEKGRVALAGHRETAFQKADQLKNGDIFELETEQGTFTYQIKKRRIVDADDRSVVVETDRSEAVIYTCWPLQFGAPTEERLVFYADMIKSKP